MNNLLTRGIFGALYVSVVLMALLLGNTDLYIIIFAVFIFVGICEYSVLARVNRTRPLRTILDAMAGTYLFVVVSCLSFGYVYQAEAVWFAPYLLYLFYIFVRAIYSDRTLMPVELAKIIFGQVYLVVPFIAANVLSGILTPYFPQQPLRFFHPEIFLLIACVGIWSNDTGAFVAGSLWGNRKLFPSVSPNKSWEGFWGGLIASIASVVLLGEYVIDFHLSTLHCVLMGIVISVAATWGDLFESMLKRQAGVKDSGKIIPGHGGILDRIDSMLFVFPALTILLLIIFVS